MVSATRRAKSQPVVCSLINGKLVILLTGTSYDVSLLRRHIWLSTYRDRVAEECWMASFVQKLEQVDIVRLPSEVLAHELVNGPFQKERIVEGFEPNIIHLMPRQFPVTRRDFIDDILRHGEVRVQLSAS
jgi:hypothetical protein